jgi:hypothetical protein
METLYLENREVFYDVYAETDFEIGENLVILNNTADDLFICRTSGTPSLENSVPIAQYHSALISNRNSDGVYVTGARGSIVVQRAADSIVPSLLVNLPDGAWTSRNPNTRRLQVDAEETGFEEARLFYCNAEATIPAGTSAVYKFVFDKDFIMEHTLLTVLAGHVRVEVWKGGTDNGGFVTNIPIFPSNRMDEAPAYTSNVTKMTGGTYNNDGELIDYIEAKTDLNANRSNSSPSGLLMHKGLPADTYYFVVSEQSGNNATDVIIEDEWQERPSQFL